jgi:site-specific recombinase XerD
MIDRENYLTVRRFLDYRSRVIQNDYHTIATYWQSLKHMLQWAGNRSFKDASKIMPPFPEYLLTARNKNSNKNIPEGKPLTPKYMGKVLSHARAFFEWARTYERGFTGVTEAWTKTLQPRRSFGEQSRLALREYWRLEDVRRVIALEPENLREERDIAALAFLFVSGMRIGAFVTLPAACVDIARRRIEQLPERGVQTKNHKAAITFFVGIPDLLAVVEKWDAKVKALKGEYNWYPALNTGGWAGTELKAGLLTGQYTGRAEAFDEGMKMLCERAGVPYKSPHKIRHGHGVYAVKNSKNMGQLKAVSQNMMHAHVGITDGIYGKLAEDELSDIMAQIGEGK